MQLDVRADMAQCPSTYMVVAPGVQTASFPFGLRSTVFVHGGSARLMQPACTVWADAAVRSNVEWAGSAGESI